MAEQDPRWDEGFEPLLRPFLSRLPGASALTVDLDLWKAGLDSLGAVELLMAVEDAYGVEFAAGALDFDVFSTPATLWEAISVARGGAA